MTATSVCLKLVPKFRHLIFELHLNRTAIRSLGLTQATLMHTPLLTDKGSNSFKSDKAVGPSTTVMRMIWALFAVNGACKQPRRETFINLRANAPDVNRQW